MATLTDAERESLADACDAMYDFGDTWVRFLKNGNETVLLPVVERIIADHLAQQREEIAQRLETVAAGRYPHAQRDFLDAASIAREVTS